MQPWMIERLECWIKTARTSRSTSFSSGRKTVHGFMNKKSNSHSTMRERSAQTQSIIARVLGSSEIPSLMRRIDKVSWVEQCIEFAEHTLAVLRTRAETFAKLGTSAPTMKADALHSLIWGAASKRWESGHFSDAVPRSATALSGHVDNLTGRHEVGDNELMTQAFSLSTPQAGKPRLRWPGNENDLTVKAMRVGILNMAQGVFPAIRNPETHSTDELPK